MVYQQTAGLDMEGCGMNIKELEEQAFASGQREYGMKKFAELVAAHEREECIQNVLQQHEGFGTEHQGVGYVKQRIVEAIRARGKA